MSKKDKLSIEKCKRLLGKDAHYTDEQVEKIRKFLYELAEIQIQNSILNGELDRVQQGK
jgi:hypothetical protein